MALSVTSMQNIPYKQVDPNPARQNTEAANAISVVSRENLLEQESLPDLFSRGTKAVRLEEDARVHRLWSSFVHEYCNTESQPFWENDLRTIAKNHYKGQLDIGDLVRFCPNQFGHFARKIITYLDEATGRMQVYPRQFHDEKTSQAPDQKMLRAAWDLASDVYQQFALHNGPSDYAVSIDLLKYPDTNEELNALFAVFGDSGVNWTKRGQRVDSARGDACGPFSIKGISDLYALLTLTPVFGPWLQKINDLFRRHRFYKLDANDTIIGAAHTDGVRALSLLMSDRDTVKTEVYDGQTWTEIALQPDTLTILPGDALHSPKFSSTIHRYSIKKDQTPLGNSLNLSIVLGIVDRNVVKPMENLTEK